MAELNLKQIIDRLNEEFMGDTRKLIFWYDDKAEFAEDIQGIELINAKVYFLKSDNQLMQLIDLPFVLYIPVCFDLLYYVL